MFEEMIQQMRDSVRGTVLDSMHDFISNDGKYPLALTQKQLWNLSVVVMKVHLRFHLKNI